MQLQDEVNRLEKIYPNQIGLYIKDLNTGEEYSLHADEKWYLASTVKVPIAIEVLKQVDAKKLSLEDKIEILADDYVDGNGPLKNMNPGDSVSIRFLLHQMIALSDNMATDMLIRVVGLNSVNQLMQTISPGSFSPITTLKDVRRHIYGGLHAKGREISGRNMIDLRRISDPTERLSKFMNLFQLDQTHIKLKNIDEAYQAYYKENLNSATPRDYSKILEALWEGNLLSPESRKFLIDTMLKTETGQQRIKAGLKPPFVFAHKTGTQYQRIGDVGYIWNPHKANRKPIIVISFVRGITQDEVSAKVLAQVAKYISKSGVL